MPVASHSSAVNNILNSLKALGNEGTARVLINHGARQPCYGVKIADMKKLLKPIMGNKQLALELFSTGVYDAMYLAGLAADGAAFTKKEMESWVKQAYGGAISEYTVPWVACENKQGYDWALEWIDAKEEYIAVTGWATLGMWAAVMPDAALDLNHFKKLLNRVEKEITGAPNRVKYVMNGFVICVACHVAPLGEHALKVAAAIKGRFTVNVGNTACKVPLAEDYVSKLKQKGTLGQKRKHIKC